MNPDPLDAADGRSRARPEKGGPPAALRRALLDHYDRSARRLPWRGETDPYRVLVAEVMLQQTRVETVKRYYGRWLKRFPDVEALAAAGEDEVLKAWEGLGYYRRARNLHRAARVVRDREGGALPVEHRHLRALPGIGEYTAGAVASIAFGEVVPAVDGNVRRVLSRLFDEPDPKGAWLRETASALVDPDRPGDWNQAVMELGATVCAPRSARCDACPVARWCAALRAGTVSDRPASPARRELRRARLLLGVYHHAGRLLLVRRPRAGLLAGMWAFPETAADGDEAQALRSLTAGLGLSTTGRAVALEPLVHRFTHLEAVYLPRSLEAREAPAAPGRAWVDPGDTSAFALPVAQRRVLEAWSSGRDASRTPSSGEDAS